MALTGQEFAQGVQGANLAAQAMQQPWQDREQMQMLQSIYNDPNYQGKPVSEILSAAGKKFLGTNSWKTGLDLMEKSDLAQVREARASQAQQVELQNTLDSMSNDLTSIDDTNEEVGRQQANAYIDQYMSMSPKLAQQGQRAKMLLNSGNMNVATFKQKIQDGFLMPFKDRLALQKEKLLEHQAVIQEKKFDEQITRNRAMEARYAASLESKDTAELWKQYIEFSNRGVPNTAEGMSAAGVPAPIINKFADKGWLQGGSQLPLRASDVAIGAKLPAGATKTNGISNAMALNVFSVRNVPKL